MEKAFKATVVFLVMLFVFGLGIGVGHGLTTYLQKPLPAVTQTETPQNFGLFWEVWGLVEDKFYGDLPSDSTTTYDAIRGALAGLNDPYTVFVEPQPRALEKAELAGQFGGIGAYLRRDENDDVRLTPIIDSPAEKAGMQKDDILLQVDDTPITPELTEDDIVLLVRGEVGTKVKITLSRAGEKVSIALEIERAIILSPTVEWRIASEDASVGVIKIRLFAGTTGKELSRALTELSADGATRYILDLRSNGGGLLTAAVDVASAFLSEGLVLTENRRAGDPQQYFVHPTAPQEIAAPLVVLVDGGTASASEIVAGALRDHNRAQLIGERTYGKGSVQLVYDLSDASSLHVTVARWMTPSGHSIDGEGLSPDVEILFSEDDHAAGRDPQYLKAIDVLKQAIPTE